MTDFKTSSRVREIRGCAEVRKIAAMSGDFCRVTVVDAEDLVHLSLSTSSFPAGLTAPEARYVAAALIASAGRIDHRQSEPNNFYLTPQAARLILGTLADRRAKIETTIASPDADADAETEADALNDLGYLDAVSTEISNVR